MAIGAISDGEAGSSVRGKLNSLITLAESAAQLAGTAPFTAKQTFSAGVVEPSGVLAQSGSTLTLPEFTGQTHRVTPSADIDTIALPTLTPGQWCRIEYYNTGGFNIVQLAGWHPFGMATPISSVAGSITAVSLHVLGNGALEVHTTVLGLV